MNTSPIKNKSSVLVKIFVSKAFYFLDQRDFSMFEHLCRTKSVKVLENALLLLSTEEENFNLSTNLCLVDKLESVCMCALNSSFKHLVFISGSNENDFCSWARILSRRDEGKLRLQAHLLLDRRHYQEVYNHVIDIIAGEFLRMSPEEIVFSAMFLRELHGVRSFLKNKINACEADLNSCCKSVLKHSVKLKFHPQMFSDFNLNVNITEDSKNFLRGVTKRFTDVAGRLENNGIDVNHFIDDDFTQAINALKDSKILLEHGLSNESQDVLNKLIDALSNMNVNVNTNVNGITETCSKYAPYVLIGVVIYIFPAYEKETKMIIGVVGLLVSYLFPHIKDILMKILEKLIGFCGQSSLDIIEDFVTLTSLLVLGKDYKSTGLLNSFKKLKDYERFKIGTVNFFKDILNFLQKFLNHIMDYFGKERYIFYDTDSDLLGSHLEEVDHFVSAHSLDSHISYDDGLKLSALEKRDIELNKILVSSLDRQKLYHARRALDPYLQKKRAMSWFGQSYRTEPTAIIMVGDSHIGKSTVMIALLHEVTARLLAGERLVKFKENPGSEVYSWNWEREHADGYNRQFSVVIDDIGSTNDVAGNPNNVYSATMKMVNSSPYLLNMAELTSKADSYFASEFVWMTSNRKNWNLNSMFYNEAFVNRLRISLEVKLKEGYKKPNDNDVKYEDFEHLEFNLIAFDIKGTRQPKLIKKIGGYNEVRDYILSYHEKKSSKSSDLKEIINRYVERGASWTPQMRVFNENSPSDFMQTMNGPLIKYSLGTLGLMGGIAYLNYKYVAPYAVNFLYTKLTQFKDNIAGLKEDALLVELPPGERSLTDTLDEKKVVSHFVTKCECPYCSPHLLLKNLEVIMKNYQEGIHQFPDEFLNFIWVLGFQTDESLKLFGQSLFHFLFRDQYAALSRGENVEREADLPNGNAYDLTPFAFEAPEDIDAKLARICESWLPNDPIPLCINAPEETWNRLQGMEDYAIFVAYCCSFYIKRLNPYLVNPSLKNKLRKMVVKPKFITFVRKLVDPFLLGLSVLGGFAACQTLYYGVGKLWNRIGRSYLHRPMMEAYGLDNLDFGDAKYDPKTGNLNLHIRQNFYVNDEIKLCSVYMTIPDAIAKMPQFFSPSFEITCEDIGYYRIDKEEELHEIDFSKANVLELSMTAEMPGPKHVLGLKIAHNVLYSDTKFGPGEARTVKAQSSSGLKKSNGPIVRPTPKTAMKGQALDVTKFMNGYDKANRDIGKKVLLGNVLLVYVPNKDCTGMTFEEYVKYLKNCGKNCSILMLADRVGIMNDHVKNVILYAKDEAHYITEQYPVILIRAGDPTASPYSWVPDEKEFYSVDRFANSDIAIVKLPTVQFQAFPNIKKYFVTNDMPVSSDYNGVLYIPGEKVQMEIHQTYFRRGCVDYDNYNNGDVWIYPVATQWGDCGSILTINDKFSGCKKICGFHIAGNGVFRGASYPLFREDIDAILKALDVGGSVKIPLTDINNEEVTEEEQREYPYRLVGQIKIPTIPFRSRIKPAPLHDVGEITHVPASSKPIVYEGQKIVPSMNALWKNIPASEPLSISKIRLLFKHLLQFYKRVSVVDREKRLNTFEEAVLGIPDDPYYKSMSRNSSAGLTYKIDLAKPGLKGKQILFGDGEEFDLNHPGCKILRKDVEDEIAYMEKGKRHVIPYEVAEKDECLPKESVAKGKIRLFAVNSGLAGVLKRMYGGQFRTWFAHNRIYNGSAIGINVYSNDWNLMCKHLMFGKKDHKRKQFVAMDVSKFDGTVNRTWMYCFYEMVCDWYGFTGEKRKVQMEVFESQMHSFHVFKGKLFERVGSQSSGDEYTALLNTALSQAYVLYAISLLVTGSKGSTIECDDIKFSQLLKEIMENVRFIALGDDIVISINPEWEHFHLLTEKNIIETYNKFGINATTDAKDGSVYEFRSLEEITFLKRRTYWCEETGRYIGKLEVSSIMKSVQWMRDNDPHYEAYRLTLQHALEELALHDDLVFNRYVAQIKERGEERVSLNLLSYEKHWLKCQCLMREDFF